MGANYVLSKEAESVWLRVEACAACARTSTGPGLLRTVMFHTPMKIHLIRIECSLPWRMWRTEFLSVLRPIRRSTFARNYNTMLLIFNNSFCQNTFFAFLHCGRHQLQHRFGISHSRTDQPSPSGSPGSSHTSHNWMGENTEPPIPPRLFSRKIR